MIKTYSLRTDGELNVSPNFKVKEFACRDGADKILIDTNMINIMQKVRTRYGVPININSGYRTNTWNAKVGGLPQSRHLTGEAVDFSVGSGNGVVPHRQVCMYLETIGCKSIILYLYANNVRWIHAGSANGTYAIETAKGTRKTIATFVPTLRRQFLIYTNQAEVEILQLYLMRKGFYNDDLDGKFGPATKKAVYTFQLRNKLDPTGVCDKATWTKLLA
jgi:hypothetical protein